MTAPSPYERLMPAFTAYQSRTLVRNFGGFNVVRSFADLLVANSGDSDIAINTDIVLTANITITKPLWMLEGGTITTNGYTLTINAPFNCGAVQCFITSAGQVVFGLGSIAEVLPHWFGAIGDNSTVCTNAIAQASAAINTYVDGCIFFPSGIYRYAGPLTLPAYQSIRGTGAKTSVLRNTSTTANGITLSAGAANTSYNNIIDIKLDCLTTSSGAAIGGPADPYYVADVVIDRYEIEGYLKGIYIPYGLQIQIGFGRLAGQGAAVANGVGVQLGDRTLGTPRLVNTGRIAGAYCSGYHTSFTLDGSILSAEAVTSEDCTRAFLIGSRVFISGSWVQATTTLYETRAGSWPIEVYTCYHLNGASVEVDDPATMSILATSNTELSIFDKSEWKGAGVYRQRFATSLGRGFQLGTTSNLEMYSASGSLRIYSDSRPLEVNRNAAGALTLFGFYQEGTIRGYVSVDASGNILLAGSDGNGAVTWSTNNNVQLGAPSLGTTATNGFAYIPTCAGTPTGVPTTKSGYAPLVIDSTNNKLYFYSGGAWRDAGP